MKLSKDDLSFALNCAKQYFYDNLNSDYPDEDDQKNGESFRKLEQEADNDTLEIEGYIREDHFADADKMGWVKFDSSKGATYPPKEKFLAWGLPDPDCDGTPTEFFCWRDDGGFSCNESAYPEIHFWRPRPKPPVRPLPKPLVESEANDGVE